MYVYIYFEITIILYNFKTFQKPITFFYHFFIIRKCY